jgi:hypothetical protein
MCLSLGTGLALGACFDASEVEVKDDTGPLDTADSGDTTPVGVATVSGSANRTYDTCPPTGDFDGTLCVFLAADCLDIAGAAASAELGDAYMYLPTDTVSWEISEVPDGSFQLWAFLDDDGSGCDATSENDLASECQVVEVLDGADVSGLTVELVTKCD